MVVTADVALRGLLESAIFQARRILERDLEKRLEGRFGIHTDGRIEEELALRLSPPELAVRRDLEAVVVHFEAEGETPAGAVQRLLREASFTHLNRLAAIRIAEAVGLIPQALAAGRSSRGFKELLEIAPVLTSNEWGGYWQFLQLCGDELAGDAPVLFSPRNPLLSVEPSSPALDELVEIFSAPDLENAWNATDTLGWTYQFFNSRDERKTMKEAASAPRTSRELAVLNQFFTPRYVVDYLVQNTLGRRLLEAGVSADLVEALPMLVDHPEPEGVRQELGDFRVLDPACGSGHFLLGAYDLLERAWELEGVAPPDAAALILSSLWGVDIDARCAQVASAALMLRARHSCPRGVLPPPNIITARPLPDDRTAWDAVLSRLAPEYRPLVEAMRDSLTMAPLLGPLLKVDEQLAAALASTTPELAGGDQGLFSGTPEAINAVAAAERAVVEALTGIATSAASSAADRLFSAEGLDAIRFVQAMQQRYDSVLMNPPFGAEVPATSAYLKVVYGPDGADIDLFAAFVSRGLSLTRPGGYVGAITSRTALFLSSFEKWRRGVLMSGRLVTLTDLGQGVMDQAMVEAAAYVLARDGSRDDNPSIIRLLTSPNPAEDLEDAVARSRTEGGSKWLFRPALPDLRALPAAPLAYWADSKSIRALVVHPPFQPLYGEIKVGLQTGDDFRFVRAWWEVPASKLTTHPQLAGGSGTSEQLTIGRRWAPILKGGASQPWFSPVTLVVDWENDGERLKLAPAAGKSKAVLRNMDYYFRPGFSWTRRAPRLIPYVVPAGCIPSTSRYEAYPHDDPYGAIGLAASNLASAFCRFYGEQFQRPNFLVDNVKAIPIANLEATLDVDLARAVRAGVAERRALYTQIEPFREFVAPAPIRAIGGWDPTTLLGRDLEDRVAAAYGLTPEQGRNLETDMREALTVQKWSAEEGEDADEELREPTSPGSYGEAVTSYLVGVAFGRWDIRIGVDPTLAPMQADVFAEMAACPPGALLGSDDLPALQAPDDYPILIPPDRLLVDEPGNDWDIEAAVLGALRAFSDDIDAALPTILADFGQPDLRAYLRRRFFRDHMQRYTSGRRKAPIYWHLAVPSRRWGVWIYAPALSREQLFAIARKADRRLESARDQLAFQTGSLARELKGRSEAELAAVENLVEELHRFSTEAQRVADLGWEPDLNDGLILCAAPLANLFPGWPDLQRERAKLREGKYEWATVSGWGSQL